MELGLKSRGRAPKKSVRPQMDYTKLTIAEIANGISKTEAAIRRCREILDDLQEPKTVGMQAVVKAIRDLLPKLEEDLKALGRPTPALPSADLISSPRRAVQGAG